MGKMGSESVPFADDLFECPASQAAQAMEQDLADELQEKGWGVWQA
jgi:hypothetical protein